MSTAEIRLAITNYRDNETTLKIHCPFCGNDVHMKITADQYDRFCDYKENRKPIQDCLPDLDSEKRETLLSGMCEECQKSYYCF